MTYKSYQKRLKILIRSANKNYYYENFDKHKGNKKKTWEIINKLRGKVRSDIKASIVIDNELIKKGGKSCKTLEKIPILS